MNASRAITISDLKAAARRRLPSILFDYIEGGVDGEEALEHNEASFRRYRFIPRYLRYFSALKSGKQLFGSSYALPFGFAPAGTVGMFRRHGDRMLAQAAAARNIPYVMSGASNSSIEETVPLAREQFWYQLYPARDRAITDDLVRRAGEAGAKVLVITVDVPVNPKRERNLRNGFSHRMRINPRLAFDGLTHPAWLYEYLRNGGIPVFANWTAYAPPASRPAEIIDFFGSQSPCPYVWEDVARLREIWPHALVVKGILSPEDALASFRLGADGIIVSNHGGRQLDRSVSTLEMLPLIRATVGSEALVMMDSGISRGSDIVTALCLGADFCFVGRAAVYGVAAHGFEGALRAVDILSQEIEIIMRQLGSSDVAELDEHYLKIDRV